MIIFGKDYPSTDLQNSAKDILLIASQILKERLFAHKNEIFFCPRNSYIQAFRIYQEGKITTSFHGGINNNICLLALKGIHSVYLDLIKILEAVFFHF